jgi:hypothetical protein
MVESPELRAHPEALSHQCFPVFRSLGGKPKSRLERSPVDRYCALDPPHEICEWNAEPAVLGTHIVLAHGPW